MCLHICLFWQEKAILWMKEGVWLLPAAVRISRTYSTYSKCYNTVHVCGAVAAAGPWCTGIEIEVLQTGMYTRALNIFTHLQPVHHLLLPHQSSQIWRRACWPARGRVLSLILKNCVPSLTCMVLSDCCCLFRYTLLLLIAIFVNSH